MQLNRSSDVATVGHRPRREERGERGAEGVRMGKSASRYSALNDCVSPSGGASYGAGGKPRSKCLRGDV